MGAGDGDVAVLAGKYAELRPHLDERAWRLYLGSEARARAAASGAVLAAEVAAVAAAAGVSRATVSAGAAELAAGAEPSPGRQRRPGAGRPRAEDAQGGLRETLLALVDAATRGDPVAEVRWTTLSLRDLERELAARGFRCRKDAAARILHEEGYSLQGMAKVLEGRQHPDRDEQFRRINAAIAGFAAAGDPVISVDAKKKEQLGPYGRAGTAWRPQGDPVQARSHDFPDPQLGKAVPYGVYDIAANRGFVTVGTSRDTPAFAVASVRRWWLAEGSLRYPGARRLLVTCDAGGSNACASRGWKSGLADLAAETGLEVTVMHFPPGTSKWNKIEHRLFCHVTRTWRARPLMTREDAVAGIAATVTAQGLKCTAVLDDGDYPEGEKTARRRMRYLEQHVITRQDERGEWNYTLRPAPPQPGQDPPPGPGGPGPALLAALAALAGLPAPAELAALARPAYDTAREHHLHARRGHDRRCAPRPGGHGPGSGYRKLSHEALLVAAACHARLAMPWALLARLFAVHRTTISVPAAPAAAALRVLGLDNPAGPSIKTLPSLLQHATAAGITIPAPQTSHDTPGTANLKTDGPNPPLLTHDHWLGR
jgi:Rhodopirellula transposase DDE domain